MNYKICQENIGTALIESVFFQCESKRVNIFLCEKYVNKHEVKGIKRKMNSSK